VSIKIRTSLDKVNFGEYLHQLRVERQLPQRTVANKLGIDISLLSKIEHGDRFVQGHMLEAIAELFNLNYRDLQIQFLNQRLDQEFGKEPFIEEALIKYLNSLEK
jgi:transcriptional regulator with XRE-family HTH domain